LGSKIIAGGANNQLLTADIDQKLFDKGIHYIPDVLINSGGVIGLTKDALNKTDAQIEEDLKLIGKRVLRSIETAKTNNVSVLSDLKTLLV
jgi:leucine dehydrogenase